MGGFTVESGASPPLAVADTKFNGLPLVLETLPACAELVGAVCTEPTLVLVRSGSGKRWFTTAGRVRELSTAPGMLEFYGEGCRIDLARWEGTQGEVIGLGLPVCSVNRLLQDDAPPLDLQTRYAFFDPALATLLNALWNEGASNSSLGKLYTEGVTLALIGLLSARYGEKCDIRTLSTRQFGARDRDRLRSVIAEQLTDDLRVDRLAESLSMSPHVFAKKFKATFGLPPHSYILEQRIEAASRALRADRHRPLAEIAGEFGFSSQAHFTEAFHRRIGTTPARWRRNA